MNQNSLIEINIKKFNIKKLQPDRIILIVGKRGTGKSTLVYDILSYLSKEFDAGCGMSPTPDSQDMMRQFMPDSCIYEEYDQDKITEIVDSIDKLNKNKIFPRIFIILDDCMFDQSTLKTTAMRKLHYNGRHLKILFVNIAQYTMDVPKSLRGQIDYIFALREPNIEFRTNLWRNFFGMFPKYEDFSLAMDKCTSKNECLVMDNTVKSNNIEDCVFWYKAKINPKPFMMGNRNFWKIHYHLYKKPNKIEFGDLPIPAFAPKKTILESVPKPQNQTSRTEESIPRRTKKRGAKNTEQFLVIEKRDENGGILVSIDES